MTKILLGLLSMLCFHSTVSAACKGTELTKPARLLDLNGLVNISQGKGVETVRMTRLKKRSEEYKMFKSIVKDSDAKLISAVYGEESEGLFAVVQDQKTCSVYLLGTDDGSAQKSTILKIEKKSIQFINPNNSLVSIQKTGCPETDLTLAARNLDLLGDVTVISRNETEKLKMDIMTAATFPEEFGFMTELAQEKNQAIISKIFASDEGAMAIVQDQRTCQVSLLGADGEDIGYSKIETVGKNSINYILEGNTKVSITK